VVGCQIFLGTTYQIGKNIPNGHKIYRMATKCDKWPKIGPNGHEIYQHLPLKYPPKFTLIGIMGLKKCHLATLVQFGHDFLPQIWAKLHLKYFN
jgi:hypothetical protein